MIPTNHIKTVKNLHPGEADFALGNQTILQLIMTTIACFLVVPRFVFFQRENIGDIVVQYE